VEKQNVKTVKYKNSLEMHQKLYIAGENGVSKNWQQFTQ
jgi:hypothetical protein